MILLNNIRKLLLKKKAIILVLYHLLKKALDLISVKKSKNKENLDLENLL